MARQGDPHPFWRSLVEEPYSTLNLAYRSYGRPAHSGNGAQTVRPICNHGPADAVGIAAGGGRVVRRQGDDEAVPPPRGVGLTRH